VRGMGKVNRKGSDGRESSKESRKIENCRENLKSSSKRVGNKLWKLKSL
jgi:hypothetical protein